MEKRSSGSPADNSRVVMDPRYEEHYWQWYPYGCSWDYTTSYNSDGPLRRVPSPRALSHSSVALSVLSDSSSDDSNDTQNLNVVSIVDWKQFFFFY